MNWFKRLCLSEQYRLATLGTLRRRLPDDPWRVRPHAPVTDTQNRLLSCGPEAIIYAPASACNLMNWFKRLSLSEQYRLATLGTLRRRLPDDRWRVRPHAPGTLFLSLGTRSNHLCASVTDRSDSPASCGPEAIIYSLACACNLMNWFKRLCLSEQYRLAT